MLAACSCVLEEEGAGGCAGCLLVCPRFVDHFLLSFLLVSAIFDCGTPWRSFYCFLAMKVLKCDNRIVRKKIKQTNEIIVKCQTVMRKPIFGVCDRLRLQSACSTTETS